MLDSTGTTVASYEYDPFGNIITATGTMAEANPLRYRGYYYDRDTGFYYLNSRYYDPKIGRFINADSYVSTGQGIVGYNMFAYCGNNPVNKSDPMGDVSFWDFLDVHFAAESWTKFFFDPSWGGFGYALLDTVGAMPIIPSSGYLRVGAEVVDSGLDATRRGGKSVSTLVDDIVDILKSGEKSSDGRNIITQLDDNTKAIFRMDVGENAHSMNMYGYSNPVDHINIEIQVKTSSGKYKTKWNFHIILDDLGNVSDIFSTGIWTKK